MKQNYLMGLTEQEVMARSVQTCSSITGNQLHGTRREAEKRRETWHK
jgi:hypothetical protein